MFITITTKETQYLKSNHPESLGDLITESTGQHTIDLTGEPESLDRARKILYTEGPNKINQKVAAILDRWEPMGIDSMYDMLTGDDEYRDNAYAMGKQETGEMSNQALDGDDIGYLPLGNPSKST